MARPEFWLIAGPNGAGKTTLVSAGGVPGHVHLLNPDKVTLKLLREHGFRTFSDVPKPLLNEWNIRNSDGHETIAPQMIATGGRGLLITLRPGINRAATRSLVESPLFSHKVGL